MWGQVFVIAFSVVSDALNIIQSIPYIPFLIESFHITDSKKQVGYLAGLLMSISHICQIFSSITTFLFGFTFNIWWVFLTKGLSGLLYENIGIANTILNEICSSGNQALCMSVVGFSFGIGSVGGPILGGYTVHLDAKKGSFLDEYPYFLPNGICAGISIIGAISNILFLSETLKKKRPLFSCGLMSDKNFEIPKENKILSNLVLDPNFLICSPNNLNDEIISMDEFEEIEFENFTSVSDTDFLNKNQHKENYYENQNENDWAEILLVTHFPKSKMNSISTSITSEISEVENENATTFNKKDEDEDEDELDEEMDELNYQIFERNFKDDEKQSFGTFLKSHKYIFLLCLLYGLISFIFIFFDTIVPLLLFQEEKDGGLDLKHMKLQQDHQFLVLLFIFQILLYPKISRYISPLNAYRIGVGANALVFVAFPFINSIHVRFGWQAGWAFYLTAMVLRSLFESLTYSSTFILINNSAKSFRFIFITQIN
ncbi:mfs general substrate transporter [Anaeramoeba ignava]|uniref:Mfs general substrate transporter n=1 Tax=Anaeramoeba ignava TaxID=1746090 RepID=A0A9Q0L7U9_ANAIG|nr:mfs general substrate transporter [Anaeramoeba ignava]